MLLYDKNGNMIGECNIDDIHPVEPEPVQKKRIALCIGHNNKAQGAVGEAGISEYRFNDDFLQELITELPYHDYRIFERPAISSYSEQQNIMHAEIAKWGNCDIAVEFHFNAAENDEVHGHEVLFVSSGGQHLAKLLDEEYDRYLDSNDRGVKQLTSGSNGYGFLRRGSYMSILVEPFFAAFQNRFIVDGDQREQLKRAYIEFFKKV